MAVEWRTSGLGCLSREAAREVRLFTQLPLDLPDADLHLSRSPQRLYIGVECPKTFQTSPDLRPSPAVAFLFFRLFSLLRLTPPLPPQPGRCNPSPSPPGTLVLFSLTLTLPICRPSIPPPRPPPFAEDVSVEPPSPLPFSRPSLSCSLLNLLLPLRLQSLRYGRKYRRTLFLPPCLVSPSLSRLPHRHRPTRFPQNISTTEHGEQYDHWPRCASLPTVFTLVAVR